MAWKRRVRRGDFLRVDDRTGFTVPASKTRKEWTGAIVESSKWEPQHPQMKLPSFPDKQAVPEPRPEHTHVFVGALKADVSVAALAGATAIHLETTARMQGGDHLAINLDSGDIFRVVLQTVDSSTQITIATSLPGPVSVGNVVTDWSAVADQGVN